MLDVLVSHFVALSLKVGNKLLDNLNQDCLDFASRHLARAVRFADLLKFVVVFQEEGKVLEGHVDVDVCTLFALLLESSLSAGEGVAVDLLLDIIGCVSQQNAGSRVRAAHFRLLALQGREERRVN